MDRSEQITGGIIGLLIGDAVGVPYEFHEPQSLPPIELLEMTPPAGFQRSHQGTPVGTWSDDGANNYTDKKSFSLYSIDYYCTDCKGKISFYV
jgi:ADP-ribosylglycohydrolase